MTKTCKNSNDDDDNVDDEWNAHSSTVANSARKREQELHRRHSKRYRNSITELLQSLEKSLPKVLPGGKLKAMTQIISISVDAVVRLWAVISHQQCTPYYLFQKHCPKLVEDTTSNIYCIQEKVSSFILLLFTMQI